MSFTKRIANTWNQIRWTLYLPLYDLVAGTFGPYRAKSLENLPLKKGDRLLISGAGSGLDLPYLPKDIHITAIDITPGMIHLLKRKAKKQGLEVKANVMDGMNLQFEDNSFDYVVLHLILAVIPDPVKCLQEAERVLKPGGTIAVFDKFVPEGQRPGWFRQFLNVFLELMVTSVNRDIDVIRAATRLEKKKDQPIAWAGLFRVIVLQKP